MSERIQRPEAVSPLRPAARQILGSRMRSVARLVKDVSAGCIRKPEYIHQLRVAIRRAEAAISAFEPELRPRAVVRARRRLRSIRKAAGAVRDCDVHRTLIASIEGIKSEERSAVAKYLTRRLKAARRDSSREVLEVASSSRGRKIKKSRRQLLDLPRRSDANPQSPPTLLGAALRTFARVAAETRTVGSTDLSSLDHLHELRVKGKQVRYAVEIFRTCIPEALCESTLTHLREFQAVLGRVNDARQMSSWLAGEARYLADAARPRLIPRGATPESIHEELRVIVGRLEADLAAAHQAALPLIPAKLDAALRPLEEWTRATMMPVDDGGVDVARTERRFPAGRQAEGAVERGREGKRLSTPVPT